MNAKEIAERHIAEMEARANKARREYAAAPNDGAAFMEALVAIAIAAGMIAAVAHFW